MSKRELRAAARKFAKAASKYYAHRLKGAYVIDSKQLFDREDAADIDVALVLADGSWRLLDEKWAMSALTTESLLEDEIYIRVWIISASEWIGSSAGETTASWIKPMSEPLLEVA